MVGLLASVLVQCIQLSSLPVKLPFLSVNDSSWFFYSSNDEVWAIDFVEEEDRKKIGKI